MEEAEQKMASSFQVRFSIYIHLYADDTLLYIPKKIIGFSGTHEVFNIKYVGVLFKQKVGCDFVVFIVMFSVSQISSTFDTSL